MRVCASPKAGVVERAAFGGRGGGGGGAASAPSSQSIRLTHIDRRRLRSLIAAAQCDTRTTGRPTTLRRLLANHSATRCRVSTDHRPSPQLDTTACAKLGAS